MVILAQLANKKVLSLYVLRASYFTVCSLGHSSREKLRLKSTLS